MTSSTSLTWSAWNYSRCKNSTSTADTWSLWTASNTSCTTTSTNELIFRDWALARVRTEHGRFRQRIEAGMTPEERERLKREREERAEARRIEREERMKKREAAILKAERLLRSCLTPEQEETLTKDHYFEVTGGKTGTKYRIRRGRHINIEVLGARGQVKEKICFAPRVDCPDADAMLCQKLMLELDEEEALRVAYKHSAHTGILHGYGDRIVPQERRDEILAEVVPIGRARRAA